MTETELIRMKTLLEILSGAVGLMADAVLHATVQARLGERITLAEFELLRSRAERERWISGVKSRFTESFRWQITDEGRAALAQM